jgi:N-acetylglucosaminyldiphosphoundecaprenol N-acetyl-beta-D-mannosaminyltransferase/alpha-1,3-mannosyltransferase
MHTFNLALNSPAFSAALSKATVFNDGIGIDVASRILFGAPFPDNLNGTDLTPALLASLDRSTSLYLVGGPPGVAEEAARVLESRFACVSVVGCHHGFLHASRRRTDC